MKKIPKISKNTIFKSHQQQRQGSFDFGLYRQLARYILRGMGIGFLFQGSFHIFGFQNRIIRGVTSKQLDQLKQLQNKVVQSLKKGQALQIDENLIHERFRQKIKKRQSKQQDKK